MIIARWILCHHAYVAEPLWHDGTAPRARVLQLTCSPVHNAVPAAIRFGFRFGWSRLARGLGSWIAGHGRSRRPKIDWRRTGGPWFGNQLMTLTLGGRAARLRLEQAHARRGAPARLRTVMETDLTR